MDLTIWACVVTYEGVLDDVEVFTRKHEADEWLRTQVVNELMQHVDEEKLNAMSDDEIEAAWRERRAWSDVDFQVHERVIRLDDVSEEPGPELNKDATNFGGWNDWR